MSATSIELLWSSWESDRGLLKTSMPWLCNLSHCEGNTTWTFQQLAGRQEEAPRIKQHSHGSEDEVKRTGRRRRYSHGAGDEVKGMIRRKQHSHEADKVKLERERIGIYPKPIDVSETGFTQAPSLTVSTFRRFSQLCPPPKKIFPPVCSTSERFNVFYTGMHYRISEQCYQDGPHLNNNNPDYD